MPAKKHLSSLEQSLGQPPIAVLLDSLAPFAAELPFVKGRTALYTYNLTCGS